MQELIIGIGIVVFLFMFLATKLEKEHFIMKLLLIFMAVSILILIPKATLDQKCENVVNQTFGHDTYVDYLYIEDCHNIANGTTSTIFYKAYMYFLVVFWLYVIGFFAYKVLLHYGIIWSK